MIGRSSFALALLLVPACGHLFRENRTAMEAGLTEPGSVCPWVLELVTNDAGPLPRHRCDVRPGKEPSNPSDLIKPKPLPGTSAALPPCLRRFVAHGTVILNVALTREGRVSWASVNQSDLHPDYGLYLASAVRSWEFTEPVLDSEPINACARLPIPVTID